MVSLKEALGYIIKTGSIHCRATDINNSMSTYYIDTVKEEKIFRVFFSFRFFMFFHFFYCLGHFNSIE